MAINVDLMDMKGSGSGELAGLIVNGRLDPGKMRPYIGSDGKTYVTIYKGGDPKAITSYQAIPINANATLRRDEWKQLDEAVLRVSRERLSGIDDLISNNLIFNLGNAMGTTVLEYHKMSDAFSADLTMDGVSRGKGDRPEYSTHYLPIPILHVDYELNLRALNASRNLGNPLDTTDAEMATRKIREKLEEMLFTDVSYSFGGGAIKSYVNFADRNKVTLTAQWTASGVTGKNIVDDVLAMKQSSINAKHFGPWILYIPVGYETLLDADYDSTTPGTTIRERIKKIEGIKDVKVVDKLTAHNILLVQMTSDTVRLVRGMGIQNVEWKTEGNFITKYKVMTIQVPQIRSDVNGNCGIVHMAAGL